MSSSSVLDQAKKSLAASNLVTAVSGVAIAMVVGLPEPGMLAAINTVGAQAVLGKSVADAVTPLVGMGVSYVDSSSTLDLKSLLPKAAISFGVGFLLAGLDGFGPMDMRAGLMVAGAVVVGDYLQGMLLNSK